MPAWLTAIWDSKVIGSQGSSSTDDCYAFFQMTEDIESNDSVLLGMDMIKKGGLEVDGADYSLIYGSRLKLTDDLESVRTRITAPALSFAHALIPKENRPSYSNCCTVLARINTTHSTPYSSKTPPSASCAKCIPSKLGKGCTTKERILMLWCLTAAV